MTVPGAWDFVCGKATRSVEIQLFLQQAARYRSVVLDLGAGDGAFAYRYARGHQESLVVAVDPARDRLVEYSAKAAKKPARGGIPNVFFMVADAGTLPEWFTAVFSQVFILFPWASLLSGVLKPDHAVLAALARVMKTTAQLEIILNLQVIMDKFQRTKLQLPLVDNEFIEGVLGPVYSRHGLLLDSYQYLEPHEVQKASTWRGRLARGSRRRSLQLIFTRVEFEGLEA